MFDIFYMGENPSLEELFPFAKKVSSHNEVKPNTKMYWIIDPNIEIIDTDVFEYRPEIYDMGYTHVWKWDNQNYGGVTLLPKNKSVFPQNPRSSFFSSGLLVFLISFFSSITFVVLVLEDLFNCSLHQELIVGSQDDLFEYSGL